MDEYDDISINVQYLVLDWQHWFRGLPAAAKAMGLDYGTVRRAMEVDITDWAEEMFLKNAWADITPEYHASPGLQAALLRMAGDEYTPQPSFNDPRDRTSGVHDLIPHWRKWLRGPTTTAKALGIAPSLLRRATVSRISPQEEQFLRDAWADIDPTTQAAPALQQALLRVAGEPFIPLEYVPQEQAPE